MRKWKITVFVMCLAILFSLLTTVGVGARGSVEIEKEASLALTYSYDGTVFEGLSVKIYRVADVQKNGSFLPAGAFSDYALQVNEVKSQSEWKQIAQTAAAYAVADGIVPTAEGMTDAEGKVQFTALPTGLYLVEQIRADYLNGYCQFDSFMITLPGLNAEDQWQYELDATPKSSFVEVEEKTIEYSVLKLWKDAGFESLRPKDVEIDLYKDGVFLEKVTLSASNNWSYSWKTVKDGAVWTAVEPNVANGYTVTLEQRENTFVVINTYEDTPPPPTGDAAAGNVIVIIAAVAGLALMTLGAVRRRRV